MQFSVLKSDVAGKLSRDTDHFTKNGVDHLANAINQAQRLAQRLVDFELLRAEGYLPLTDNKANWRTEMLDEPDGSSVSPAKLIGCAVDENFYTPVDFVTDNDRARLRNSSVGYAFIVGPTLRLRYAETTEGLYVRYFEMLADLSADTDTNILTEYCSDWLTMQAAFDLSANYLKEEERLQYMAGGLRYRWDSVLSWNDSLQEEQDLSLD